MTKKFQVTGMTCAACSARVEKVSNATAGVHDAQVNLLAGTMVAQVEDEAAVERVIAAIQAAGYGASVQGQQEKKAQPQGENSPQAKALKEMKTRLIWSAAFLIVLMYFTMGHMVGLPTPGWYHGTQNAVVAALLQATLTVPVMILNRSYYVRGFRALFHRAPNMDSLIAVGSSAAFVYGMASLFRMAGAMGAGEWDVVEHYSHNLYFESAAMILTLITLGKFLETRAKNKTGDAIRQLMALSPKTATVRRDGVEMEIPVEQVQVGDTVIIRSGGRIPVDGKVLSGHGAVDQSALTGESVPVEKQAGDTVAAATMLQTGYLEFQADKVGQDTTLAQIIRMVEDAGGSKAPVARLADKIAGVFVPIVMSIALATLVVWLIAGKDVEFALNMAISVLVISCPCALGLATPVAIMVGVGRGAKMGVLFHNAEALENLHRVDTVVLDKTGTLTRGIPMVTDVLPGKAGENALLTVAGALEEKSEHPFAKAILAKTATLRCPTAEGFETLPGLGVQAVVNGKLCWGGNRRLMEQQGIAVPEHPELADQGKTLLYFAREGGEYLGAIAAADVLKGDSAPAVKRLQELGLDVVMLTGDNQATANAIAAQAGISNVIAQVLPADKAGAVEKLQQSGKRVLMVGDGINDAPALATADVGMAIGTGTDVAVESADVVLMSGSLGGISKAVELSRAAMRNIRENLFWAFFYNVIGIPVAAGVLYPAFHLQLSPMIGAAAMSMSSVFVVTNALRLRRFRPGEISGVCQEPVCQVTVEKTVEKEEETMETVLKVEGMMCNHCKMAVEKACKAVPGTVDAVVELTEKKVTVKGTASRDDLTKAITDAGYEVVG